MLHHKAPHRDWEPDERNKALFKDAVIPEPDTLWDDYATRPAALPENQQTVAHDLTRRDLKLEPPADLKGPARNQWLQQKPTEVTVDGKTLTGKDLVKWKYQRYMQDYLACVQGVDDNVGKMLDYLDRTGLAENTIVIYSADNGWYLGDLGLYDKRFMYEPGLHVPLLARGPGIKAGITPDQFVANIDLAPTFLDLAGLPVPDSMQGRSLAPLLRGESPADWRKSRLLSLLPQSRPSQHGRPLRRPHRHAQAHLLLGQERLRAVRPDRGSDRAAQPALCRRGREQARSRRGFRRIESRDRPPAEGVSRRRPIRRPGHLARGQCRRSLQRQAAHRHQDRRRSHRRFREPLSREEMGSGMAR